MISMEQTISINRRGRHIMGKKTISKQLSKCLVVSLAMWGLILLSSCSQTSQPAQTNPTPQTLQTAVKWDASWSRLYHDVRSLKQASDLTVVGSITSVSKVIKDNKGIVTTFFVFSINHVVWNPHH